MTYDDSGAEKAFDFTPSKTKAVKNNCWGFLRVRSLMKRRNIGRKKHDIQNLSKACSQRHK